MSAGETMRRCCWDGDGVNKGGPGRTVSETPPLMAWISGSEVLRAGGRAVFKQLPSSFRRFSNGLIELPMVAGS